MEISAIIPAYNEEKNIKKAVISLKNQDFPKNEFEVIVVNDGSTDKTKQIAERYADLVINQDNKGPAIAKNKGAEKSKGKILVFMDSDTIVSNNYFKEIIKACRTKNIIGGKPNIKLKSKEAMMRITYDLRSNILSKFYELLRLNKLILQTTCCFYRKKEFMQEAGFKKFTFDDAEMSIRMREKGRFTFLNKAVAYTSDRKQQAFKKDFSTFESMKLGFKLFKYVKEFQKTQIEPKELKDLNYFKRR